MTVLSSFLLLSIACIQASQTADTVAEAPKASDSSSFSSMLNPWVTAGSDTGALREGAKPEEAAPEELWKTPLVAATGAPASTEAAAAAGEPVAPTGKSKRRKKKDGCYAGQMQFEGRCCDKSEVDKILEQREREALVKVQTAKKPGQTADAAHELLEQQIAQMDKAEDDLDEIIEQLKEEQNTYDKEAH